MEFAPASQTFALGQKIEFSIFDYVNIASTFMLFAQQLEGSVLKKLRDAPKHTL